MININMLVTPKIGIHEAIKTEEKSSVMHCSKILDHTAITSSPNDQNGFKHFVAANLHHSHMLNHTRFDNNVILKSVIKTIKDPLETVSIEINVSLFLRQELLHIQFCQFLS